jgi:hypothetical protein
MVEQAEYAALFEMTWAEYRRDAACGVLSKIFEDIFMGAYWEAYGELSVQERKKLLELAAMCSRPGSQIDWILSELLPISDDDTLPVFRHFATEMDKDTPEFGNLAWPTSAVCFGPPLGTLMLRVLGSAGA